MLPPLTGYWAVAVAGYVVGLAVANAAVIIMASGQPALLYLCPCVFVPMALLAQARGEFDAFWRGPRSVNTGGNAMTAGSEAGTHDGGAAGGAAGGGTGGPTMVVMPGAAPLLAAGGSDGARAANDSDNDSIDSPSGTGGSETRRLTRPAHSGKSGGAAMTEIELGIMDGGAAARAAGGTAGNTGAVHRGGAGAAAPRMGAPV
jgi:hypothetical protein